MGMDMLPGHSAYSKRRKHCAPVSRRQSGWISWFAAGPSSQLPDVAHKSITTPSTYLTRGAILEACYLGFMNNTERRDVLFASLGKE